jgi:L-alanine-DL-glutamate epimerase-like enolase superfamily enzyme
MTTRTVVSVETYVVTLDRDTPYLGPLGPGEFINERGYIVRKGNGTIYPTVDRSVVVRITTDDGAVGWGETYGICAPRATCEIINDLLAPVLRGRDPEEVEAIWDELYGLMRVRGCTSGFHVDAIAALDIALWDLRAQGRGQPLGQLLGPARRRGIPCYLSGLPAATLEQRVQLALEWQRAGLNAFKFAAVVSHEGIVAEFAALRRALGKDAEIMVDLHWKFSPEQAIELAAQLQAYRPYFLEAPVKPEDVAGLADVCRTSSTPIAGGEEWYTEYDARLRLDTAGVGLVQPEMGHTGITQFLRIAALAGARGVQVAPHATIGTGIFLAASVHASATLDNLWKHEWQHSVFERNLALLDTDLACRDGVYHAPTGPGLGVRPNARFWQHAELIR